MEDNCCCDYPDEVDLESVSLLVEVRLSLVAVFQQSLSIP